MTMPAEPIVPPATVGMLGGGQLGKYALIAANAMGYRTIVVDPDPAAPARVVADEHVVAAYDDSPTLSRLARECSVVTTEFENAPADALEHLAASVLVAPPPHAVAVAQNRIVEKTFLVDHGIAVGPYVAAGADLDDAQLRRARELAESGAVVKTAQFGYDGKGQRRVSTAAELDAALAEFDSDCIVEALLDGRGPRGLEDTIVANTSLALWVCDRTAAPSDGVAQSRELLLGGSVKDRIARTREFFQS